MDKLFDLDEETYTKLFQFSRKVAKAMEKAIPCKRVGLSVIGLEVPHVHVHLIPLNHMEDIQFNKKEKFSDREMQEIANQIASEL